MAELLLSIFAWLLSLIGGPATVAQKQPTTPAPQVAHLRTTPNMIRVAGVPRFEELPDSELLRTLWRDHHAAVKRCAATDRLMIVRLAQHPDRRS